MAATDYYWERRSLELERVAEFFVKLNKCSVAEYLEKLKEKKQAADQFQNVVTPS